jgi:hypothetical protein
MSAETPPRNGRPASTVGDDSFDGSLTPNKELVALLSAVYDQFNEGTATVSEARQDFVFHMTDWLHNLKALKAIYDRPGQVDQEAAGKAIASFLYHVIPHLSAAGRLLLGEIPDAFKDVPAKV